MTTLLATTRTLHFASLMAIFGGSAYAALLRRAGLCRLPLNGTRPLFAGAAALAIVSAVIWFGLIAGQMSGSWRGSLDLAILHVAATGTRFGQLFLGRVIGLAALWLLCAAEARSHSLAVPILAGLLLASLGPISHAAATAGDIVSIGAISDAAHLLTAGFWLGGLGVLALFLRRHRADPASLRGALRLFSTWGAAAVAVLVITGLINVIAILPVSEMSLRNAYFDVLLAKVGLASLMIGLAASNRWHFAPALRVRHLAASVGSEIILGCAVVAIAGFLGLMAPQMVMP